MRRFSIALVLVGVLVPASAAGGAALGWSLQQTPSPAGTDPYPELTGVSCASKGACTAVGDYFKPGNIQVTLAERWNGSKWSIQRTPNPSGAKDSELTGVSCASNSACTAVGDYSTNGINNLTLAERWNGTKWSIQRTPNATKDSELSAVSCVSKSACTAVGAYFTRNAGGMLAERWNGSKWSIQGIPNATGATLDAVSCASNSACTAVGDYSKGTLAERWNGSNWSIQSTPNPTVGTDSELRAVSCASEGACTAVGDSFKGAAPRRTVLALAESWNGTEWSLQSTPNPAKNSGLYGVSCASASACTAVGWDGPSTPMYVGNPTVTLAERSNGTRWMVQSTHSPAGAKPSVLNGVSCPSEGACTAVGYYYKGSTGGMLAERWSRG